MPLRHGAGGTREESHQLKIRHNVEAVLLSLSLLLLTLASGNRGVACLMTSPSNILWTALTITTSMTMMETGAHLPVMELGLLLTWIGLKPSPMETPRLKAGTHMRQLLETAELHKMDTSQTLT